MGTMNGPDSTLWRERGGWEMTNSHSGMENSCLGLQCRCSHDHHSDNSCRKHATRHSHQHPPASGGRRQSWAATVKKELCDSYDSPSLSVYLLVFNPPPTFSVTRALSLSPSPSLCPCALTVSSLTAEWREADARVYLGAQAPASTTRLFCSALWREGLCALKAQGTAQSLISSLCWRPHSLSHFLSSFCHSSIEGVISLLNHDEVFLFCQQPLGTGCPKVPGCYIINIQSKLVFDDLIWRRDRNREGGPAWLFLFPLPLHQHFFFFPQTQQPCINPPKAITLIWN